MLEMDTAWVGAEDEEEGRESVNSKLKIFVCK